MDVVCSSEIDEAEYGRFLESFAPAPGAALSYHYPFYLRFLADAAYPGAVMRVVLARDVHGEIEGVMPAIHVRTPHVNAWLSLAYFGPNAGALVREPESSAGRATIAALAAAANADACRAGCGSMTICTPLHADATPYREGLGGAEFDIARVSQVLEIPADPAVSPWPRKVRYDIRRAAALGVTVRTVTSEAEVDAMWDIYRDGCDDAGIPIKPKDHVRRLYQTAGDRGLFLVAEHDGAIVAGLVALTGGGVLSYYLPCTRSKKRSLQPGLALLDRAVILARERGCRLLNFESSPGVDSAVFMFKARCGGQPAGYRVLVKLLRAGVLDEYRALSRDGIASELPHAFLVPFEALAS